MQLKHLARHLWLKLEDPDVSELQVIDSLRALGSINVDQPSDALELASLLHPQFLALKAELPFLNEILDGFALARRLSSIHIDIPDPDPSYGDYLHLQRGNHFHSRKRVPSAYSGLDKVFRLDTPQFASACAVQWIAHSMASYFPNAARTSPSGEQYHPLAAVLSDVERWAEDSAQPQERGHEISDIGFFAWQSYFSTELLKLSAAGKGSSRIFDVGIATRYLVDVNSLLGQKGTQEKRKIEPNSAPPDAGEDGGNANLSYPRDFSVRNLLKSHWNYPRPAEIRSLKNFCLALKNEATPGRSPPQDYECILIALALCTGRSIAEVLNFPINSPAEQSGGRWATDFLQVELVSFRVGDRIKSTPWVFRRIRGLSPNDWIRLALPRDLSEAILASLYVTTATRFEHLLPLSGVSWEDRCYSMLQSKLSISRKRAELLVRDFLGRQIFALTTNAALVRLLCDQTTTDQKNGGRRQLALSYYLDLRHGRVWEAYKEACKLVISFDRLPVGLEQDLQTGPESFGLTLNPSQFTAICTYLLKRIPSVVDTNTLIKAHNGFAEYTLFLLIAATGHRKSLTPFFFPWDICPEEKLAFISDKQVTGSEARFVPLPQLAVDQYVAYQAHLVALASKISDFSAVAKHVQALLSAMPRSTAYRSNFAHCAEPQFSQFFFIDAQHQPQSFGTNRLDQIINDKRLVVNPANWSPREIEKAKLRVSVRRFRNGLADYLWGALKSGSKVQAWLGHAPELHSFGEASTWSVQEWASEIRPHIQLYLTERGLVYKSSPLTGAFQASTTAHSGAPSILMSAASYEGRAVSSKFAATRALKVLRQMLPEDYLELQTHASPDADEDAGKPLVIDDLLQIRMAQELRNRLGGDRLALDKVQKTINEEFRRLRKRGAHVTAASINLFRSEPGPVCVGFARHLRIACEIRRAWLERWVSEGLGRPEDLNRPPRERLTHLAHLAISLVIFDATLDPVRVRALVLAATSKNGLYFHPDTLTLRARITTARDIYDWLILPSPITSAQLFGIQRVGTPGVVEDEEYGVVETKAEDAEPKTTNAFWKKIDAEISLVLARMQAPRSTGAVTNMTELCMVFRPWWHLRLPGALYAIATGEHVGPSPSRSSEQSLFAAHEPQPFEVRTSPVPMPMPLRSDKAQKRVLLCINKIFSDSEGDLSKTKRANLEKILKEPYPEELRMYVNERPIVQHALGFIEYLLDVGGPQQPILRFNSIRTYYSKIVPLLVERWWDKSIAEWSSADFDAAYREIVGKSAGNQGATAGVERLDALRQFHRYLRDTAAAPFSAFLFQQKSQPARRRSDVVTWRAVERAVMDVRNDPSISDAGRLQAETMIAMAAGYGLRHSEVTALTTDSFFGESEQPLGLAINRNRFADIKTSAGRRIIAQPLMNGVLKRIAAGAYKRAKAAEKPDVASSRNARLIDIGEENAFWSYDQLGQRCISALRRASTSNTTVLHSLRHTFATAMMLELFGQHSSPAAQAPISGKGDVPVVPRHRASMTARERLISTLDRNLLVSDILQVPPNWPFAVDLLAQVMGHADVSTLLGCYFHGTPILLAEHTHGYSRDADLVDGRLALLLGLERSTVTKRRKSFATHEAMSGVSKPNPIEQALSFDRIKCKTPSKTLREPRRSTIPAELESMPWDLMDDLLLNRSAGEHSFAVMHERALEMHVGAAKSTQFIESYRRIVEQTGFDDFEFRGSELVDHTPTRTNGVSRAKEERQTCLRMLQSKSFADRQLRESLCLITKIWFERTTPQDPWLVLRDVPEAQALEEMCRALDIRWHRETNTDLIMQTQPADVKVYMTGTPATALLQYLQRAGIPARPDLERSRFSRSGGRIKASEVGVQFIQRANARLGDGRDAHRLLLVLAAALLLPTQI